jgi:hypothetical protein
MKMSKKDVIDELKKAMVLTNRENQKRIYAINYAIAVLESGTIAPDWSEAPEWADWYAIDADGQCFWYENEPVKRGNNFFPSSGVEKLHYKKRDQTLFERPKQ